MNFLEAVKCGKMTRRKVWPSGVAMFVAYPEKKKAGVYKYEKGSRGNPYVATCHVAACELGGVRTLADVLADDWELMYSEELS